MSFSVEAMTYRKPLVVMKYGKRMGPFTASDFRGFGAFGQEAGGGDGGEGGCPRSGNPCPRTETFP